MTRIIVALLLALALLPGAALGETERDPEIEELLNRMTVEEKVGQMMIADFRVWKEVPAEDSGTAVNVTELNEEIRACLADCHFGGVLLYGENCRDAEQTLRLTAEMQAANRAGGGIRRGHDRGTAQRGHPGHGQAFPGAWEYGHGQPHRLPLYLQRL